LTVSTAPQGQEVHHPAAPEPARELRAEGLVRDYGKWRVVNGVNVHVQRGEVVGLLGPNGAGKTTTFYMIVGLLHPTEGSISMDGEDITGEPVYLRARRGLGYLAQEPSIFRRLSVRDNVMAVLETMKLDHAEREERLARLLEDLNLTHLADRTASKLSGGERRRVEITRALVLDPRFMLLDEPFSGIVPIAVIDIQKIIAQLRERGIGIVITDHNVREALSICDRAYIIKDGRIIREGAPGEITEDPTVREIYLGQNFRL
jgi:lipopolysaccharide export system ATP-binding protein